MFTGLCATPRIRLSRERIRCKNEGRGKKGWVVGKKVRMKEWVEKRHWDERHEFGRLEPDMIYRKFMSLRVGENRRRIETFFKERERERYEEKKMKEEESED